MSSDQDENGSEKKMGTGIAVGIALGAGIGVAMDNIAMGSQLGWFWELQWGQHGDETNTKTRSS